MNLDTVGKFYSSSPVGAKGAGKLHFHGKWFLLPRDSPAVRQAPAIVCQGSGEPRRRNGAFRGSMALPGALRPYRRKYAALANSINVVEAMHGAKRRACNARLAALTVATRFMPGEPGRLSRMFAVSFNDRD